jgi:hypothetical protein
MSARMPLRQVRCRALLGSRTCRDHSPFVEECRAPWCVIMSFGKSQRLARKTALLQQAVVHELQSLVKSIERAETLLAELKEETEVMNAKHQHRTTTREDIAYLEDLLKCAKKKLVWEKQMENVAKRIPAVLAQVSSVMNDTKYPPDDELRMNVVEMLQSVQQAMTRLEVAKNS